MNAKSKDREDIEGVEQYRIAVKQTDCIRQRMYLARRNVEECIFRNVTYPTTRWTFASKKNV